MSDLYAAVTRVMIMADEEVQRPGDNEQRFRALIRIRDFARGQLDSGISDQQLTSSEESDDGERSGEDRVK